MEMFKLSFALFTLQAFTNAQLLPKEAYATVPQLILSAGYPVNKYRVTTGDGYILQMYRIPAGRRTARRSDNAKGKRPVLLMHGLMGSSDNFLIMGPDKSLGYMLADAGYDVWLGNMRGTVHSAHQNLTRQDAKFWNFSFDEHGKYDLPAMIDKVLSVTKLDKLFYIGHSMGTTTFFVMMSEKPEYNKKIVAFIALSPAVYIGTMKPFVQLLLRDLNLSSMLPVIVARVQPGSWQQFEHYGKLVESDVFTAWENGFNGTIRPYNISNVKVPVEIIYGENDQLVHKTQVLRLAEELKSIGVLEDVRSACSCPNWNHFDFVFAKNVGKLLNIPLVKDVNRLYNKYNS
ncbi:lipase 1-like isoform X3 [Pieris brassicae]|uniref:lipase 1-like isoform X3 n=1 Tax=Pieris brassicae TaxID=7116 RepID=UPI001E65E4A4|nr:lipase 1-like isoform X3 [Pieris brassicae]